MTQAPAGWYADPASPARLRYWDGAVWTEHVAGTSPRPAGGKYFDGVRLGGWWARGLALLIDSFIVGFISLAVGLPGQIQIQRDLDRAMTDLERSVDAGDPVDLSPLVTAYADAFRDAAPWLILGALAGAAYYVVMVRWRGATLGKMALGLRIRPTALDGRVSWGRSIVRALAVSVPNLLVLGAYASGDLVIAIPVMALAALYGPLDLLWAAWDRRNQTLHDKIAGTIVVRTR